MCKWLGTGGPKEAAASDPELEPLFIIKKKRRITQRKLKEFETLHIKT
jgi:hypothetical protein